MVPTSAPAGERYRLRAFQGAIGASGHGLAAREPSSVCVPSRALASLQAVRCSNPRFALGVDTARVGWWCARERAKLQAAGRCVAEIGGTTSAQPSPSARRSIASRNPGRAVANVARDRALGRRFAAAASCGSVRRVFFFSFVRVLRAQGARRGPMRTKRRNALSVCAHTASRQPTRRTHTTRAANDLLHRHRARALCSPPSCPLRMVRPRVSRSGTT